MPMSELRVGAGDAKPGYKLTVVGEIPDQWRIVTIHEACDLVVDCKNRTPPFVEASDFAVVRTPNVRNGQFILDDLLFTDEASYRRWTARAVPQAGDIMLTREAPLGEVCAVPTDRKVCLGQRMMLLRPSKTAVNSEYVRWALLSKPVRTNLLSKVGGSTVGHAKVDDVRFLELPLPPLPEQQAIAAALSDVDALIGALDRLIAKKRDLKQAAMQQLLTGQTRLPGFSGKWDTATLGAISAFITKGATPTTYGFRWEQNGIYFLRSECVGESGLDLTESMRISSAAHAVLRRSSVQPGDVLITITGNVGRVVLLGEECGGTANINQHIARIRINTPRANALFLFHQLSQPRIRHYYSTITTGQAYPQISLLQVRDTVVDLPSPQEQVAIADVLSAMDVELAELRQRLDKTRKLKQGMMQELLTGRIRLI
jgi:type I restriction enzyme S subunit